VPNKTGYVVDISADPLTPYCSDIEIPCPPYGTKRPISEAAIFLPSTKTENNPEF